MNSIAIVRHHLVDVFDALTAIVGGLFALPDLAVKFRHLGLKSQRFFHHLTLSDDQSFTFSHPLVNEIRTRNR
jgi:hypothetical protein